MSKKKCNRRDFVKFASMTSTGLILAACSPVTQKATEVPATVPPAQGSVWISYMGWGATEEDEAVKKSTENYMMQNPGINVNWIHISDYNIYHGTFKSMVAGGTAPDTAFVDNAYYMTFARDGLLFDITDLFKADLVIGKPGYFIEPQETKRCLYKGKYYGLGSCWEPQILYYNADTLQRVGIDLPSNDPDKNWDWDTMVANATKFTKDKNGRHPDDQGFDFNNLDAWGIDIQKSWAPFDSFVVSNGGKWYDDEANKYVFDSPEGLDAIQKMYDLNFVHHVSPSSDSMNHVEWTSTPQMLETGRIAFVVDGGWALSWMHKIRGKLGTACLPKLKTPATNFYAFLHCMTPDQKHVNETWKWMTYLCGPEHQKQMLVIGLWSPNQSYFLTPEGLKEWITPGVHPDGYADIVTKYIAKYGDYVPFPPGFAKAANALQPAYDALNLGDKKATEVIPPAVAEANKIIAQEANT